MTQNLIQTQHNPTSWDIYFIKLCELIASKSKDPSTKVGAVVVGAENEIISTGFNGFPRGVEEADPARWERPEKYKWIIHAEANAALNAARIGVSLKNTKIYMNYAPCPCSGCSGAIIQAGIKIIVGPDISFPGVGKGIHYDVDDISKIMLDEAKIIRITIVNITEL